MKASKNRTRVITGATTAILGMALIGLASCSSGDSSTPATPGGSSALQGPLVFVHNSTAQTTSVVALKGDTGSSVIKTLGKGFPETGHPNGAYNGNTPGDMQFSEGEWVFVNVGGVVPGPGVLPENLGSRVALIDPLSGATPIFEDLLQIGERPVHMYRDPTDGEVIWSMIDGNGTTGVDNVSATFKVGNVDVTRDCSATDGGSVVILHNSHIGQGGNVPKIIEKVCLLAKGHKVAAFSSGTSIPKRAFVSSEDAGEIAVIDNDETSSDYLKMISRIDLCKDAKEPTPCDDEAATPLTTAFSPNASAPHGIRWSKLTQKVYSISEGYGEIVEIDPTTLAITRTFDLAGTPYTGYGITPDGRFLLLRGQTTAPDPQATKLGVLDISVNPPVRTDFTIAELDGTSRGSFKFSPDGKRFYILAGNSDTSTKKDRLFAFDSSTLTATPPVLTLIKDIGLDAGGDTVGFNAAHNIDVLAQGAPGAGKALYIVVSNRLSNSISIINATDNLIKQTVTVGASPGAVLIYYPDAAASGNQASS